MAILGILGTIFKIIGILLLCILLLLLFILLLLLFVPLRYRAQLARESGKITAQAQASYLFGLIRLPVDFKDGKLIIRLKVFGLTLFSNADGAGKKKGKADKKKKKKRKDIEEAEEAEQAGAEQTEAQEKESEKDADGGTPSGQVISGQEPSAADTQTELQTGKADTTETGDEVPASETGIPGTDGKLQEAQADMPAKGEEDAESEQARGIFCLAKRITRGAAKLVDKVRNFFQKLAGIYEKITAALQGIMEKISTGKAKIADLKEKAGLVLSFLRDEENKNGIKYAGKSIFRLLKHVLPYKIEGDIVFATGNAYSMGQAFSALGILYPLYAKKIKLTADFEAEAFRLEGRVGLKGRIRFGTILWIAFRLWQKGKILRLLAAAKELKQKLTASAL